eukprot:CAMPEP_0182444300 /NCGR_PEP_ID=MMETSP1172-20130603/2793_1 /TAXON_ID=708627 /ORGANISM="Timspurckia oligopyrenoides, Strain CCMP3278" /LENGTH=583 /DNA_ID=CAMNT_0024639829 /DNA_START=177 /DNA_END=1928 /DNA_ORIENTATION=-
MNSLDTDDGDSQGMKSSSVLYHSEQLSSLAASNLGKLSLIELKQLQEVYKSRANDDENAGGLTESEFHALLSDLTHGNEDKIKQMKSVFTLFDVDSDGRVSLREFLCGMSVLYQGSSRDRLQYLFLMFDDDGSGDIDAAEFKMIIQLIVAYTNEMDPENAEVVDEDEIDEMVNLAMKKLDVDESGKIEFNEFESWAENSSLVAEWLTLLAKLCGDGIRNLRAAKEQQLLKLELQRLGLEVIPSKSSKHFEHFDPNELDSFARKSSIDMDALEKYHSQKAMHSLQESTPISNLSNSISTTFLKSTSFQIKYEEVTLFEEIGCGTFAQVFRGEWLNMPVAVKRFQVEGNRSTRERIRLTLESECELLSSLRHPNVLLYMGIISEDETQPLCMVSELFSGGSLSSYLSKNSIDTKTAISIANQIARGMYYLHSRSPQMIHRDLKSLNILVNDHCSQVVICDFGLSIQVSSDEDSDANEMKGVCGTVQTMAPEVMKGGQATAASDVYSYGILLWELFTNQVAWSGMQPVQIMYAVYEGRRPSLDVNEVPQVARIPETIQQLIQDCWDESDFLRPSFKEITFTLQQLL